MLSTVDSSKYSAVSREVDFQVYVDGVLDPFVLGLDVEGGRLRLWVLAKTDGSNLRELLVTSTVRVVLQFSTPFEQHYAWTDVRLDEFSVGSGGYDPFEDDPDDPDLVFRRPPSYGVSGQITATR